MSVYYIKAGWLFDGTGTSPLKNPLIIIKDGIIKKILPENDIGSLSINYNYSNYYNFSDHIVLPPFIDSHVHLAMSGTCDPGIREKQLNYEYKEAFPIIYDHVKLHNLNGIIAVRDGGDYGGFTLKFARSEKIFTDNIPMIIRSPGKAWRNKDRYGKLIGRPPNKGETLAEAILKDPILSDYTKIVNSGINSLVELGKLTPPQFTHNELKGAVAASSPKSVMVHANGPLPVLSAITAGATSIEHGFFAGDKALGAMAEYGTVWVPTCITMDAYSKIMNKPNHSNDIAMKTLEHQLTQIAKAYNYGVTMAAGTDAGSIGVNHGISLSREIELFTEAGVPISMAIRYASLEGAKLLGIDSSYGSVECNKFANLIGVKASLADLAGKIVSARFIVTTVNGSIVINSEKQ